MPGWIYGGKKKELILGQQKADNPSDLMMESAENTSFDSVIKELGEYPQHLIKRKILRFYVWKQAILNEYINLERHWSIPVAFGYI